MEDFANKPLTFTTFDVFTDTRFRGNPLAIVHVPVGVIIFQDQKQFIAREFNLSETVFLHEQTPADIQAGTVRIDIFTPFAEIPFAGHPTIGVSYYLLHHLRLESASTLATKAGPVPFRRAVPGLFNGNGAEIAVAHNYHIHNRHFISTNYGKLPVVSIVNGMTAILAQVPDLEVLAEQTANLVGSESTYTAKEDLDEGWRNGPVVTYFYVVRGWNQRDNVMELFTRNLGSREDPATGSAAAALCSFLSLSDMRRPLTCRYRVTQGVEMGRESVILVKVTLNSNRKGIEDILVSGQAVRVLEGKIPIPDAALGLY
ncbi:Diaminopimelate epimerase-like protein [Hypoxylon crocopeplum]|nr:Diaminopimelate epimerase-like protein [Hypoxylon crocopeplum]